MMNFQPTITIDSSERSEMIDIRLSSLGPKNHVKGYKIITMGFNKPMVDK
ncbi:hypothetical protein GCM10008106_16710 [Mongoliitalea lutea]|uniref:Uncharacterized protein n=1 Tax=Mongoliitalea lutea TaxID=849756 RepID=A0A8J3CWH1_9BACT|nr:hypothetical protein GCM10008106_16710 [Mongoliitalea lutea]